MKIIKESRIKPSKRYGLNLNEDTFDRAESKSNRSWNPNLIDCPECGDISFDSKKGRCTKCSYRESLTEASHVPTYDEPDNMGRAQCAPLVTDVADRIEEAVKYLGNEEESKYAERIIKNCVERLMYDREAVENFNKYWTERYPACIKYIEDQLALVPNEFKSVEESLTEATTHTMPGSMKMGKKSGETFSIVVAVDQNRYIEESGLDRTTAHTKAATLSRSLPTAYITVLSSDDPRINEFNGTKPNETDANGNDVKTESVESLKEDVEVEAQPAPQIGPKFGLASMLNVAIQDEWKTIDLYNSLSVTATSEGYEDIAKVIDEINTEESKHVGQLQAALKTISPNANAINDGEREGEAQLNGNLASDPLE